MKLWDAIQWAALRDVYFHSKGLEGTDPEYQFRRMFRWYSEKFATPLHVVQTLPLEDVARAYFEQTFEDMSEEDLAEFVKTRAVSDVRQREIEREEDRTAADMFEVEAEARANNAAIDAKLGQTRKLEDVVMPVQHALSDLLQSVRKNRDATLASGPPPKVFKDGLPPEIKMTFISEEEMEDELERDSFGLFAPSKKPT